MTKRTAFADFSRHITIQRFSVESPKYESFQPYLNFCVDYFRENCPKAKVYIRQVWSYENDSPTLKKRTNYKDTEEMFVDTKASYVKALVELKADVLIRSGEVMLELMRGGFQVHRDVFHATLGLGRYALSLLWYSFLTGKGIDDVNIGELDDQITYEQIAAAKAAVNKVLGR